MSLLLVQFEVVGYRLALGKLIGCGEADPLDQMELCFFKKILLYLSTAFRKI